MTSRRSKWNVCIYILRREFIHASTVKILHEHWCVRESRGIIRFTFDKQNFLWERHFTESHRQAISFNSCYSFINFHSILLLLFQRAGQQEEFFIVASWRLSSLITRLLIESWLYKKEKTCQYFISASSFTIYILSIELQVLCKISFFHEKI